MAAVGFDWIFFAIVAPWPIIALWLAFVPGQPLRPEDQGKQTINVRGQR